jgi:hypothetical protein
MRRGSPEDEAADVGQVRHPSRKSDPSTSQMLEAAQADFELFIRKNHAAKVTVIAG